MLRLASGARDDDAEVVRVTDEADFADGDVDADGEVDDADDLNALLPNSMKSVLPSSDTHAEQPVRLVISVSPVRCGFQRSTAAESFEILHPSALAISRNKLSIVMSASALSTAYDCNSDTTLERILTSKLEGTKAKTLGTRPPRP